MPQAQRDWSWVNMATVWMGMVHNVVVYEAAAGLMALGLTLGADVPLFVFGQNALGEGVKGNDVICMYLARPKSMIFTSASYETITLNELMS